MLFKKEEEKKAYRVHLFLFSL